MSEYLAFDERVAAFFLHHANVDRIWALWRQRHPGQTFPASAAGFTPQTLMWPWLDRSIASVESTIPLGYAYAGS